MVHAAERTTRIEPSASSVATQRARELKQQGHDIIALTQGQPDFDTPDHVIEAAIAAMKGGETRYTPVGGTPAMLDAIRLKFKRDNGLDYAAGEVMASNGGKQVVYNALMATVEPGDEVIVLAPYWVSYTDMAKFADGVPVVVQCLEENGFKLTPEQLEAAITPKTRWLILNSPNNPAGSVYSESELKALGDVLARHERVLVMSDDIYEHIIFDGRRYSTLAAAAPHMRERTLTMNGVSKAYSMTGWRIGICGGPADLIKTMSKLQNQSTGNPSSVSQAAAVAAFAGPHEIVRERTAEFQKRRNAQRMRRAHMHDARGRLLRVPELRRPDRPQGAGRQGDAERPRHRHVPSRACRRRRRARRRIWNEPAFPAFVRRFDGGDRGSL
jgi:aspartate aminotransferase